MEFAIRPETIDLLCRDQELIPFQQKSTSEAITKKEGWWSQFTKQVKYFFGKVQPVISIIITAISSLTTVITYFSKLKEAFHLVNKKSKLSCS